MLCFCTVPPTMTLSAMLTLPLAMVVVTGNNANITTETIKIFKSYCHVYQEKGKTPNNTSVVVRPIMSCEFNSRGQVDLIKTQSAPQGQLN